MPHELDGQVHWHEPAGLSAAGRPVFARLARTYDQFMQQEGIPILRDAFVLPSQIALAPWRRLAAEGAYLALFGTEGALGCALLQVPGASETRAEKHLFDEIMLVLEGRGTLELWQPGATERVLVEWQPGSLFAIPANALHRLVNATTAPALLLSGTTAPALLNLLGDVDAVFANPFVFGDRFDDETGLAFDDIEPDPASELALCRTGLVPDVTTCELPLDNRPSPGYRQLQLAMTGPGLACVVGEHRPGRYSRARLISEATLSVCLRGTGYLYMWPERLGPTPWQDGTADQVIRIEHHPFVICGQGPGGGRWYQQLFTTSPGPLRHVVWSMPPRPAGPPGEEMRDDSYTARTEGGSMVDYAEEDSYLRREYAAILAALGLPNRMKPADYAASDAI